jgi:two-component system chemotaxis response regulator CheB
MPRMDGLTFLKKLMQHYPLPVIIVSSLTKKGGRLAMEALSLGALDVISKPSNGYPLSEMSLQLIDKIRAVAKANLKTGESSKPRKTFETTVPFEGLSSTANKIIAIGASTGGTEALKVILKAMPSNAPGILVVQHMPAHFTASFAERLNQLSSINIREARDGDLLVRGVTLIAPGNYHMVLRSHDKHFYVQVKKGPLVNHQRPAADVLFHSVARYAGKDAVGVILTGMGGDGALGLLRMKEARARTLAQDEKSCVVFRMPKEAIKLGAVDRVVPLADIAQTALEMVKQG